MKRIMYRGDGEGRWWKREFAAQCPAEILIYGQCQGAKGHDGDHWRYEGDGSYSCGVNSKTKLKGYEIAGGSTPCTHKNWIHPKNKQSEYHVACFVDHGEVTNKRLLARLNRGEFKDGEYSTEPLRVDDLKPSVRRHIEKMEAKLREAK